MYEILFRWFGSPNYSISIPVLIITLMSLPPEYAFFLQSLFRILFVHQSKTKWFHQTISTLNSFHLCLKIFLPGIGIYKNKFLWPPNYDKYKPRCSAIALRLRINQTKSRIRFHQFVAQLLQWHKFLREPVQSIVLIARFHYNNVL